MDTEFFSILEFDDWYSPKWFNMFDEYYNTNEDVSAFLPINVVHNQKESTSELVNEIVWASSFSSEMGVIDFECLDIYVIPKEGYHHELFRDGSLIDQYVKEIPEDTNPLWFELAKREYPYDEDRNKGIIEERVKSEDLK